MCPDGEQHPPGTSPRGPTATPEDLILLQTTVEALRQERDQLLRRLQSVEASARERVQLAEARLREAQAQVDALKRATQQLREQFEAALLAERSTSDTLRTQIQQWEHRSGELSRLLDAAQCRIADLETENSVFAAELERLAQERSAFQQDFDRLAAELAALQQEHLADRQRIEGLQQALEEIGAAKERYAHELEKALRDRQGEQQARDELAARLQEAATRIAELERLYEERSFRVQQLEHSLVQEREQSQQERSHLQERWRQERDELARLLEEAQNRAIGLEQELDRTRVGLCSLQLREQATADEIARLEHELEIARQEQLREREVFEQLARQRQEEFAAAQQTWQMRWEHSQQEAQQRLAELEANLQQLREELQHTEHCWEEAEDRAAKLTQLLQNREAALASSREEVRTLASRLATAEEERRTLSEEREQWRITAQNERSRAQQAETEAQALREACATARTDLAQSLLEHCFERQRNALELLDLCGERDASRQEAERLQGLLEDRHRLLACQTVLAYAAQLECARLAAALTAVRERLEATHQLLVQERTAHRDEIAWRELERTALTDQLFEQSRAAVSLRHALLQAEDQVASLTLEREDARQQLAAQTSAHHELQARLLSLEAELAETRAAKDQETAALAQQVGRLEAALTETQHALTEAETTVAALRAERVSLLQQIEDAQKALELVRQDSERLRASTHLAEEQWQQRTQETLAQLEAARQEVGNLSERIAAAESRESELRARLAASIQEQERLSAELAQIQAAWAEAHEARQAAEERAREAQRRWEALQEQSVSILQAQEILAHENDALRKGQEELHLQVEALLREREQASREKTEALQRAEQFQALLLRQQQEFAAVRQRLDAERDALRTSLDAARAHQAQLAAQVTQLQQELAEASQRTSLQPSFEIVEFEKERAELRAQVEKLSAVIRQLGQEREEQRVAALQAQASLNARIEELAAERGTLALRVAELETLSSQLERECERLRRERLSPDDLRKHKAEIARLEARVEELERLRNEAAQNHSAVVANYMLELNQRAEALQEKDAELQRLQAELTATQQMFEELQIKLEQERDERATLATQLDELRRSVGAARVASTAPPPQRVALSSAVASGTASQPLRLTDSSAKPAAKQPAAAIDLDGLTIVHIEENKEYRERVQRLAKAIPNAHYLNTIEAKQLEKAKSLFLVVNLLNRAHDPIAAIAHVAGEDPTRHVFAYCADGKFGFLFGEATFFPSPLESSACSAWLMGHVGNVQKLLVASNDIEMTSRLRTELNRIRCSTSVALDLRQVLDLLPLIQPEVVLVDLSLPRAEGLRLVSRLRSDAKGAQLPLGILLPAPQKVAEFRQNAQRAAREGTLTPDALLVALAADLGVELPSEPSASGGAKAAVSSDTKI